MADAYKMAITLPPFLYDSSQAEKLQPVISGTYTPREYAEAVSVKAQHNQMLEKINRAVRSGRSELISASIAEAHDTITAYHKKNLSKMPKNTAQPLVGRSVESSLKSKTEKLARDE
jgi:hypothetical protein